MIAWKVILGIAKTHLFTRPKQTITAMLGVTFGIGAYITLMSFMSGLNQVLDDVILNQTPHIQIYNEIEPSKKQPIDLYGEFKNSVNIVHSIRPKFTQKKIHNALPIIDYLNNDKQIKIAIPQLKTQIFYISGAIELAGNLVGILPLEEAKMFNLGDYVIKGSLDALQQIDNGIIIGSGVAKKMSVTVNDKIQVSTISGDVFPLKVVGIYQSGMAAVDDVQSFTKIKTVQRMMTKPENYITNINVNLFDMNLAPEVSKKISRMFDVNTLDINTANAQFETGSSIRTLITYAVSITLLIVAGFGIYNILNMLIYEKMNDIAILKAIGFSGKDIQIIFLSQALIIGFIGGVIGLLTGWIISYIISTLPFKADAVPSITTYPVKFSYWYYLIGIIFALISTFFAGYLPSIRAKKLDAVHIIRGQ
ncbi:MAG: ABC transporter [Flavobacteriales bacterium]|nr:MAG: ABC transporter [Flavobacteriales bacterium]